MRGDLHNSWSHPDCEARLQNPAVAVNACFWLHIHGPLQCTPAGASVPRCTGCTYMGMQASILQRPVEGAVARGQYQSPVKGSKKTASAEQTILPCTPHLSSHSRPRPLFHSPRPHRSSFSHSPLPRLSSNSIPLPLRPAAGLQPVTDYAPQVSFSPPLPLAGLNRDAARYAPAPALVALRGAFLTAAGSFDSSVAGTLQPRLPRCDPLRESRINRSTSKQTGGRRRIKWRD